MGWGTYLGFLAMTLVIAVAVRWYQPSVADRIARKTSLSGAKGWAVLVIAAAWVFLPVLAGATTGEGDDLWMFGSTIAGVGFYLGTVAVTSVDEYRLPDRTEHVSRPKPRTRHGPRSRGSPRSTPTGSSSAANGSGGGRCGRTLPGAYGASSSPSGTAPWR